MPQFTVKEHYVPQFLLNNFSDSNGFLCALNTRPPFSSFRCRAEKICFERDLYEIRNTDGSYFDRNSLEAKYAEFEGAIAPVFRRLFLRHKKGYSIDFTDDSCIRAMIALQVIRTPRLKDAIYRRKASSQFSTVLHNALFCMMMRSKDDAQEYLQRNSYLLSEEQKALFDNDPILQIMFEFLTEECAVFVAEAVAASSFVLSDEPVLIDPVEELKYVLPVSPKYAFFALCTKAVGNANIGFYTMPIKIVEAVNLLTIQSAKRYILCSPEYESSASELIAFSTREE